MYTLETFILARYTLRMEQSRKNTPEPPHEEDGVPDCLQPATLDKLTPSQLVQPIGGHQPPVNILFPEATEDQRVIANIRLKTGIERIGTAFQKPIYYTRALTVWDTCWEAFGKRKGYLARQDPKAFYSDLPIVQAYNHRIAHKEHEGYFLHVQKVFDYLAEEHRQLLQLTCDAIVQWMNTRSPWLTMKILSEKESLIHFAQDLSRNLSDPTAFSGVGNQEKIICLIANLGYLSESKALSAEEKSMARWLERVLNGANRSSTDVVKERHVAALSQLVADIIDRFMKRHSSTLTYNEGDAYLDMHSLIHIHTYEQSYDAYRNIYQDPILAALRGEDPRPFFVHDAFIMTPEQYVAKRSNLAQVRATRAHLENYLSSTTPQPVTPPPGRSPYR